MGDLMDQYGKRLLLAAGFFAITALSVSLLPKPAATGNAAARQVAAAAEMAEQAGEDYVVSVATDPGRVVTLLDGDGAALQSAAAGEDGYLSFDGLAPGRYRLTSGASGGEFLLERNAALTALDGTLWSDGELLHLGDTPTLRFSLALLLPQTETRVVTLTLEAVDGTRFDRSFVAGPAGEYAVEFSGVPPGLYTLRRDGKAVARVCLTAERVKTAYIFLK